MEKKEKKNILKEFEEIRLRYRELLQKLIEIDKLQDINPVGVTCNVGDRCCTGVAIPVRFPRDGALFGDATRSLHRLVCVASRPAPGLAWD